MLYKGIFWIKDLDNLSQSMICAMIPCNKNGDIIDSNIDISVLGKSGNNYNHKLYWEKLPNKITNNKSFDYYSRGRVEIENLKADIYVTDYLVEYKDEVLNIIINKFNLTSANGITQIKMHNDGSNHYKPKI